MITDEELMRKLRTVTGWADDLTPTASGWDRIHARRARGEQVTIPSRLSRIPRWLPAVAAALALLIIGSIPLCQRLYKPDASSMATGGGDAFIPGMLSAQPSFPGIGDSLGTRLKAGRWLYSDEPPGEQRPWDTLLVYAVASSEYAGKPAWLILQGRQSASGGPTRYTDSTWVSRDGLETLVHHTVPGAIPTALAGKYFTVLQAAPLSLDWSTSVPVQAAGQGGTPERRWMNLRVYGEETVEVPAGSFRCWRVGTNPDGGFYFWISSDGVPVRQGMQRTDDYSFGKMNLYLVRREEN